MSKANSPNTTNTAGEVKATQSAVISKCDKGHITYAAVNEPAMAKFIAQDVRGLIKEGRSVETVTREQYKALKWCDCGQVEPKVSFL